MVEAVKEWAVSKITTSETEKQIVKDTVKNSNKIIENVYAPYTVLVWKTNDKLERETVAEKKIKTLEDLNWLKKQMSGRELLHFEWITPQNKDSLLLGAYDCPAVKGIRLDDVDKIKKEVQIAGAAITYRELVSKKTESGGLATQYYYKIVPSIVEVHELTAKNFSEKAGKPGAAAEELQECIKNGRDAAMSDKLLWGDNFAR